MPAKSAKITITSITHLVCEGAEERALVKQLKVQRNLAGFDVSCIGDEKTGNGIGGLKKHLNALVPLPDFDKVTHLALLVDADDDPSGMFAKVCQHISDANNEPDVLARYAIPTAPYVRAKANGKQTVDITVILQPAPNATGCLETLLWDVIAAKHPTTASCVDQLFACAAATVGSWSQSKRDKAKVRAAISVMCKRNPAITLSWLWDEDPTLIPVSAVQFDPLAALLAAL